MSRNSKRPSGPQTPQERVAGVMKRAAKMGLEFPTDGMLTEIVCDAEFDALYNYEIVAARHGQSIQQVKLLLAREKTKHAKDRRWSRYLAELDSVE